MRSSTVLTRRSLRVIGLAALLLPGCAFSVGTKHWNGDHPGGKSWTHYGWTSDDEAEDVADAADMDQRIAELEHRIDHLEWRLHHMPPHGKGMSAPQPPTPPAVPPAAPPIAKPAPPAQPGKPAPTPQPAPAPQPPQGSPPK